MKINPFVYGVAVLVVFFGIIVGFQTAGVWSTSGKVDPSGKAIQPSVTDPTTIKGWMTFEQIVTVYNVPLVDILTQFDLPLTTPITTAIKDLESDAFETSALITWLQNRSLPNEVPTTEAEAAITTPELSQGSVEIPGVVTPAATEHIAPERTITGKTTFQELLDWGVTIEAIQTIIGGELLTPGAIIKDYVTGKGLAFSDIKTLLQLEVDKIP
jgi:hypothetical protein